MDVIEVGDEESLGDAKEGAEGLVMLQDGTTVVNCSLCGREQSEAEDECEEMTEYEERMKVMESEKEE